MKAIEQRSSGKSDIGRVKTKEFILRFRHLDVFHFLHHFTCLNRSAFKVAKIWEEFKESLHVLYLLAAPR